MGEERIELRQRDRDRLKVLHEVERGHLKQVEAAQRLGLSPRQVRRLERRVEAEGDGGLVHRLRGRPSNRKIPTAVQERLMAEVRRRYADFGPTLASEKLAAQGLPVSRETLRKWMSEAGLWQARRWRVRTVHVWRERRAAFGELVMMDSSPFRWLEERGPQLQLVAMIDDATSRIWGRFTEQDSTVENLRTLQGWLQRYGRPLALYTDKGSVFHTTRPAQWAEQLAGEAARTQFTRALGELGIEAIPAHSPQAKGRIERLFGTLQDRLVKEMRLAQVHTLEHANQFLAEVFLPFWEQRFTRLPRQARDAHRPLGRDQRLEQILSVREPRRVGQDYTVRWQAQTWAIPRTEVRAGLRGARIEVERRLDGSRWARFRGSYLSLQACPAAPPRAATPFGLRPPGVAAKTPNQAKPKSKYIPPPDHPWRRTFLSGRKPDISILR
jgi:transposase